MSSSSFRSPGIVSNLVLLPVLIGFIVQAAQPAHAQYVETVPYTFTGGSDGAASSANLIADSNGNLYGTTVNGGNSGSACPGQNPPTGCGVVFELSSPKGGSGSWTQTVLYTFSGGDDGAYPQAGLVMDAKGNLYGTTSNGGDMSGSVCSGLGGCGVVFELSPPSGGSGSWTYSTLHTFTASAKGTVDGGLPYAGLTFDSAQVNLYGTTAGGGALGYGTVFELSPSGSSWTETVLYSFAGNPDGGSDGDSPLASVVFDSQGNLYGTTNTGGSGKGVVFELTPPTGHGAPWTESVIFAFTGKSGAYPYAGLTIDSKGNLYGTTAIGGARNGPCNPTNGCGVAYELISDGNGSWDESVIFTFESGSDGGYPYAGLVLSNGNLYGTTVQGGNTTGANCSYTVGCGVVFELTPPTGNGSWSETVLYDFNGGSDGGFPYAAPMLDSSGNIYGTTSYGGNATAPNCVEVAGCGVVFELTLEGGPVVRLQPAALIFGAQVVGTTSASKTVVVTNTGTSILDIDSIVVSTYFSVSSTTCGSTLAVGKSCKVFVTFTPTAVGSLTGTLTFTDNATNSPQTVQLSGTGESDVTLTPASATYAKRKVGTTSPAKIFTLANNQTVTLTSINASTTGDFAISAQTCGSTLAAKQKCTISVTFTPTQTGTRTGELKVTDSAASSPQTATLTGTGD
jgi:uncharacterized repeat protein (TIGR03803 family)